MNSSCLPGPASGGLSIVPESASGPPQVREPATGDHTAGASDGGLPGVIPAAAGSDAPFSQIWRLMLLLAFLMAVAWACSSCAQIKHGDFEMNLVGADVKGLKTPEGLSIDEVNTSNGLGVVERTVDKGASAYKWGKFWDFASEGWGTVEDIVSDNNDTDVKINASNNATKESIKTFVPPEPEVPAP